jgi:hypothetical protein
MRGSFVDEYGRVIASGREPLNITRWEVGNEVIDIAAFTPHNLCLTPHTSHLTPHTSHLTPHTSHLISYISFV